MAQAPHRSGIAAVVASRHPLSVAGSTLLGDALYQSLLAQPAPLETAVLAARTRLLRESMSLDWAALLYASPEGATIRARCRFALSRPGRVCISAQPFLAAPSSGGL